MNYFIVWIKYLIFMLIISGILIYVFPHKITVLIGVFLVLCSFSATKQEIKEKKDKSQKDDKE